MKFFRKRKSSTHKKLLSPSKYTPRKSGVFTEGSLNTPSKELLFNTERKSQSERQEIAKKLLLEIDDKPSMFISSRDELNSAYLHNLLDAESVEILSNLNLPESLLEKRETPTIEVKHNSTRAKRKSANAVRGYSAKNDFQNTKQILMSESTLSAKQKQALIKFFELYNVKSKENSKIPAAEWCHMLAMSLTTQQHNPMDRSNLYASTSMLNTKMTVFEEAAKMLSKDHKVRVKTEFSLIAGTNTIADVTQVINIDNKVFKQHINPFLIEEPHSTTSTNEVNHVCEFILTELEQQKKKEKTRLCFDNDKSPKKPRPTLRQ